MTHDAPALIRWGCLCAALSFLWPAAVAAEEVKWRTDYARACQESRSANLPLFIDLGSENCYWCKQLDTRTFNDDGVAALLNERFIPLRVQQEQNPDLIRALRIQSYPTLVVADPAGRILRYQEGFLEPVALKDLLNKVLVVIKVPEWMTRDFDEAGKAVASADYAKAVSLLRNIVDDGLARPVQQKSREMLANIEKQAAERLSRAQALLEHGDYPKASEQLEELVKVYAGTPAARDGRMALTRLASRTAEKGREARAQKAKELLRRAQEDYKEQHFLACLDRCEELSLQFADLPEGAQGSSLAAEIKSNPEWTKTACDQLGDRLCVMYLALADTWLKKGQPQQAIFYLERVIKQFPSTRHAEVAQIRLSRLQGAPITASGGSH